MPFTDAKPIETLFENARWLLQSLVVSLLACFGFSCAPAIWFNTDVQLPPAYELKASSPLADTSQLTVPENAGERSHGAKLTPRLVGSILLYASVQVGWHPYFASTLGGACVLLSGLCVGYRLTQDRYTAVMVSLVLAGSYVSNACFSINHTAKPFDGIALGLLALAAVSIPKPLMLSLFCFLACWTDERSMVSMAMLAVVIWLDRQLDSATKKYGTICLLVTAMAYFLTRIVAAKVLGWSSPDMSLLGEHLGISLCYWQVALWSLGDGLLLLIAVGTFGAWRDGDFMRAFIPWLAVAFAVASSLLVLDLSRATAFAFPLLFVAVTLIHTHWGKTADAMRMISTLAALLSVMSNNVEVITSIAYTPLPSSPISLLYQFWLNQ
ncbi:MAG: hypothetical protein SFV81_17665 [Pirellulaceae bacterium]|nr:hypothetical protein [Pirellulaceae bacterium]